MAASLPGVQLVAGADGDPSGFSVLGLTPDQNNSTLNGQSFGGTNLPRDAAVQSSLVSTPYDVSRGGFSGAQFSLGSRVSTPKIPFEWQRLSDEAKVTFLDSAKTAMDANRARAMSAAGSGVAPMPAASSGDGGGAGMVVMRFDGGPGGPVGPGASGAGNRAPVAVAPPVISMVPPTDLPDYRPAFGTGATRADLDGNLWIRTSKVASGGPVYDVVNRQGVLIDRVAFPFGRVIAGFGAGVVYLGVRDDKGARLELARMR